MPTIRLVEIHPIIVHFPIALLLVGVLLDFLALFLRRAHLVAAASWCLSFGSLGLVAAYLSGNLVEDHVNRALAGNILEMHKTFALITVLTFGLLFVLRILWLSPHILSFLSPAMPLAARARKYIDTSMPILGSNSRLLIGLYLLLSVGGVVLLSITGYLGGSMVYDHGVGTPSGMLPSSLGLF
ncbi:MAG: hypothetical protein H0U76_29915 [Ktedonobacteraceae bacterium]|nr:hypothetical protein [Ktedonobacteraceae bacterium]